MGLLACAGLLTDVRLVTALAIVPFAQALEPGTAYFHAAHVFSSPEPRLSIGQMAAFMALLIAVVNGRDELVARHGAILAVLGFCRRQSLRPCGVALGRCRAPDALPSGWRPWQARLRQLRALVRRALGLPTAFVIPAGFHALLRAVALLAMIAVAAQQGNRALFNAAMTFAGIHAYTQLFGSFAEEPFAQVVGGLAAIPLAWAMWRADTVLAAAPSPPVGGSS